MWSYDKRLQYPVNIKNPDPQTAKIVITQLGGPDGEIGAAMRYLNQRYAMPYKEGKAILTDIGTEELAHQEMIAAIVYQLTRNLTPVSYTHLSSAGYLLSVKMVETNYHGVQALGICVSGISSQPIGGLVQAADFSFAGICASCGFL